MKQSKDERRVLVPAHERAYPNQRGRKQVAGAYEAPPRIDDIGTKLSGRGANAQPRQAAHEYAYGASGPSTKAVPPAKAKGRQVNVGQRDRATSAGSYSGEGMSGPAPRTVLGMATRSMPRGGPKRYISG